MGLSNNTRALTPLRTQWGPFLPLPCLCTCVPPTDTYDRVHRAGRKSVNECFIPAARAYATGGCPPSLRPRVWRILLGLPPGPPPFQPAFGGGGGGGGGGGSSANSSTRGSRDGASLHPEQVEEDLEAVAAEEARYEALKQHVEAVELVTDALTCMDIDEMMDRGHYFPFEDKIQSVLLAFSRDPSVRPAQQAKKHAPRI